MCTLDISDPPPQCFSDMRLVDFGMIFVFWHVYLQTFLPYLLLPSTQIPVIRCRWVLHWCLWWLCILNVTNTHTHTPWYSLTHKLLITICLESATSSQCVCSLRTSHIFAYCSHTLLSCTVPKLCSVFFLSKKGTKAVAVCSVWCN